MANPSISKLLRGWWRRTSLSRSGLKVHAPSALSIWGDYESWAIDTTALPERPLVYSFGVGKTIEWESELIRTVNAEVHAFDPTPTAIAWLQQQTLPPGFTFHDWGLAAHDGVLQVFPPKSQTGENFTQEKLRYVTEKHKTIPITVKTLASSIKQADGRIPDILKIDVEGAEFESVPQFLVEGIKPKQLLMEIHFHYPTRSLAEGMNFIRLLESHGYECFFVSKRGLEFGFRLKTA